MEPEIYKLLVSGGPGVAALALIFWIVVKQLPAERAHREKLAADFSKEVDASRNSVTKLVADFRSELKDERNFWLQEREADREARHAMANAVNSLTLTLALHDLHPAKKPNGEHTPPKKT